jgi:hypothetical protein
MKRFEITLLIRHPNLDPAEITAELGLQPYQSWKAGSPRVTPKGTKLSGLHKDSCWNYVYQYKRKSNFGQAIAKVLDQLSPHKALFDRLHKGRGTSSLFLKLPGDTSIGDDLSLETLKKFVDLKIAFSVETFPDMP